MAGDANAVRWDGGTGHYEAHYLTLTDPASGCGVWIRYTLNAPLAGHGGPGCALWFMAMDPRDVERTVGRRRAFPIDRLETHSTPFELRIADARLDDHGAAGACEGAEWDLHWTPRLPAYRVIHPLLERARLARTVFVVPHPDLEISGTVSWDGRTLELDRVRGGQSHLWGSKHASAWAWAHCNDFETLDGEQVSDTFLDGVSAFVPRLGRQVGPSTPLVARLGGEDLLVTSPLRVMAPSSRFGVTGWRFQARAGRRRIVAEVDAARERLVGVTYHDPDGEPAYCYNTETASMTLHVYARDREHHGGWALEQTLVSRGRAHFEYGQRAPVPGLALHVS